MKLTVRTGRSEDYGGEIWLAEERLLAPDPAVGTERSVVRALILYHGGGLNILND